MNRNARMNPATEASTHGKARKHASSRHVKREADEAEDREGADHISHRGLGYEASDAERDRDSGEYSIFEDQFQQVVVGMQWPCGHRIEIMREMRKQSAIAAGAIAKPREAADRRAPDIPSLAEGLKSPEFPKEGLEPYRIVHTA
jgi:hypothetical protein